MHIYECYHYLCRETVMVIFALTAWEAKRQYANILGVSWRDIVAMQMDEGR